MPIAVVGVTHETAPVEIRERLAFGRAELAQALESVRDASGVQEAVLLSTCNRTEVYLFPASDSRPIVAVEQLLAGKAGPVDGRIGDYLFHRSGEDAVRHLFHVAAGLDSMVTGEAEIQGQVKEAYHAAASLPVTPPMAGPVLNRLFQAALAVGGRVRGETSIGEGTASVASVAVELASKIFGSLRGRRILVLGAGLTGELILDALTREGVEGVTVSNRTHERAVELARRHRGHAIPFDRIGEAVGTVDIVLSSTAAPEPVLTWSVVRESFGAPRRHPLLIIDVAIPRDVDPAVGDEPEVFLYNVDDLRRIVDENVEGREEALPLAEQIIGDQSRDFRAWYASLEVVPVIRRMRAKAEELREAELERLFRGMDDLDPEVRARVEEFARRLQNKMLHDPTARLRKGMAEGAGAELVDAVRFLYGLEGDEAQAADLSNDAEVSDNETGGRPRVAPVPRSRAGETNG